MRSVQLQRREFITLLGGATAWPLELRAQQTAKLPTIGFFSAGSSAALGNWVAALVQRLRELGWVEGRTVAIEYRWAEGHNERLAEIVAEFVRRKVDVIVTHSAAPAIAAKQATSSIPIVFATMAADPVLVGLVASLARPGGNITGIASQSTDVTGKRFELLRELVSGLRRLAIMANADAPGAVLEMADAQKIAHSIGLQVVTLEVRQTQDIAPALATLKSDADALFVVPEPLVLVNRVGINILAAAAHLPTTYGFREYVEAGGLMSYGASLPDQFRRAGDFVDKVLRGAKPGDIPVEQPTKFELVINLTTARALGLTIPDKLLALANEVIE
jgi:putative ABC transport system substrate-binding protein